MTVSSRYIKSISRNILDAVDYSGGLRLRSSGGIFI